MSRWKPVAAESLAQEAGRKIEASERDAGQGMSKPLGGLRMAAGSVEVMVKVYIF